jgi:hypothetical protein
MAVSVEMKGKLEPVVVDEEFSGFIQALNMSMAKGNVLTSFDGLNGDHVAINIPQILTIEEYGE